MILIGYSGGAQVAGLVAVQNQQLKVRKIVTVAGVLDHTAWTQFHGVYPLVESQSLAVYHKAFSKIPQAHYVGEKDTVVPPTLTEAFVYNPKTIHIVPGATHNRGWDEIFTQVWHQN